MVNPYRGPAGWRRAEQRIFSLPPWVRRHCLRATERYLRCRFGLPEDHPYLQAFLAKSSSYSNRQVASIARAHQGHSWLVAAVVCWNVLTSGIDVFEFALSWGLASTHRVSPAAAGVLLKHVAIAACELRLQRAEAAAPIPAWCFAWQAMVCPVCRICRREVGILSGWWLVGGPPRAEQARPEYRGLLWPAMALGLLVLALLCPDPVQGGVLVAAVGTASTVEVRPGGDDTNAGGFNAAGSSPGTNFSLQDSPQITIDGATVTATVHTTTSQVNITGATVSSTHNRNWINFNGGTLTQGRYEITAVDTVNNRYTLDRSAGTATQTGTGRLGGGMATPGAAAAVVPAGNSAVEYIRSATYSITSASSNVSNGVLTPASTTVVEGYETTRGDLSTTRPLLQFSGISAAVAITVSNTDVIVRNLEIDVASAAATSRAISVSANRGISQKTKVLNSTNGGFFVTATAKFVECEAVACPAGGIQCTTGAAQVHASVARDGTGAGIIFSTAGSMVAFSIAAGNVGNVGASSAGIHFNTNSGTCLNSDMYGNGLDGWRSTSGTNQTVVASITEANAAYGYNNSSGSVGSAVHYCAAYNNTSGARNGAFFVDTFYTGSSSFFVDPANGDYSLTEAGLALVRGKGLQNTSMSWGGRGLLDVGARQHPDALQVNVHESVSVVPNGP